MEPIKIGGKFKLRASATIEVMAGCDGITQKQAEKIKELDERKAGSGKPLTANMEEELSGLIYKRDNVELSEGGKTHCENWLNDFEFGRREEINSKYIKKGNKTEEEGFTLMAVQLDLGMVYKNTERKSNSFLTGECDLWLPETERVFDNKSSWSIKTFPIYKKEIPDKKYWWQMQSYGILWPASELLLCYTLVDAPEEMVRDAVKWIIDENERYKAVERMIFSDKGLFEYYKSELFPNSTLNTFIEIPEERRIKPFSFKPEENIGHKIEKQVILCRNYINTLI